MTFNIYFTYIYIKKNHHGLQNISGILACCPSLSSLLSKSQTPTYSPSTLFPHWWPQSDTVIKSFYTFYKISKVGSSIKDTQILFTKYLNRYCLVMFIPSAKFPSHRQQCFLLKLTIKHENPPTSCLIVVVRQKCFG